MRCIRCGGLLRAEPACVVCTACGALRHTIARRRDRVCQAVADGQHASAEVVPGDLYGDLALDVIAYGRPTTRPSDVAMPPRWLLRQIDGQ
jgi:hypothetical protein